MRDCQGNECNIHAKNCARRKIFTFVRRLYNQNVENGNVHYYNGWKTNKAHYNIRRAIALCGGVPKLIERYRRTVMQKIKKIAET